MADRGDDIGQGGPEVNPESAGLSEARYQRLEAGLARIEKLLARLQLSLEASDEQAAGKVVQPMSPSATLRLSRRAQHDRIVEVDRKVGELSAQIAAVQWKVGDFAERSLMVQGQTAAHVIGARPSLDCLADAEYRIYSQWGEDGIIDWLAANIDLPNNRFVEFGVESFREANCRFLLQHRRWRGLVMDGSSIHMNALRAEPIYWMNDLTAKTAFIDAENINGLIEEAGFAGPLGILSIDLDGNDYWVWKAISCVDPAIVICEYNTALGDVAPITIPYTPTFNRLDAHFSGQYFGASLPALERLAREKGYSLVGTCSAGVNAFFVRDDLMRNLPTRLKRVATFPSRHRDSRDHGGGLTFVRGRERPNLICGMPVVDVATGEVRPIGASERMYSDNWLRLMQETPDGADPTGSPAS